MLSFFIVLFYFSSAVVDLLDKIFISKEKVKAFSYMFFSILTGGLVLLIWPWVFAVLPIKYIILNLICGAFFPLVLYVFFKTLEKEEVSRVVPFIFCFLAIFDLILSLVIQKNVLHISQVATLFLLIPGAFLLITKEEKFPKKHIFLLFLSAFLFSFYNFFWQYSALNGPMLNNYMWNRLGAVSILLLLLFVPSLKKSIWTLKSLNQKKSTSVLFSIKQVLGGVNFIFYSFLMTIGNIVVIDGLQGLRYLFLLLISGAVVHHRGHLIRESFNKHNFWQKTFAIFLITLGTIILFL